MAIEKEQWIALFALRTQPALAPLSETATTVPCFTHIQSVTPERGYVTKIVFYSPSTL